MDDSPDYGAGFQVTVKLRDDLGEFLALAYCSAQFLHAIDELLFRVAVLLLGGHEAAR
jgi:hypothetical protein